MIINSYKVLHDLFINRAAHYADRPVTILGQEILDLKTSLVMAPYGPYWKAQRRLADKFLAKSELNQYEMRLIRESCHMIMRLHKDTTNIKGEVRL